MAICVLAIIYVNVCFRIIVIFRRKDETTRRPAAMQNMFRCTCWCCFCSLWSSLHLH